MAGVTQAASSEQLMRSGHGEWSWGVVTGSGDGGGSAEPSALVRRGGSQARRQSFAAVRPGVAVRSGVAWRPPYMRGVRGMAG
jgi:hypothetical protein